MLLCNPPEHFASCKNIARPMIKSQEVQTVNTMIRYTCTASILCITWIVCFIFRIGYYIYIVQSAVDYQREDIQSIPAFIHKTKRSISFGFISLTM